jgi:hypothetical protein
MNEKETFQASTPGGLIEWPVLYRVGDWIMHKSIIDGNEPDDHFFTISHAEQGLRLITLRDEELTRRMVDELGALTYSVNMDDETKLVAQSKLKEISKKYDAICKCSKCKAEFSDDSHSHLCVKCRPVECKHCNGEGYIYP